MTTYWDTSSLIQALHDADLREKLDPRHDGTRGHTFSELFSTLTKGVNFRYTPEDASKMIADLAADLAFIELSRNEILSAIKQAHKLGIRGARVHDFMHLAAARKFGAQVLYTLDTAGFSNLAQGLQIKAP